ncbi:helix-turn-helix domain-containing protein [Enterobacillus tribolii]|uniref:AraC family transcriptional activator of mar-sox-rob regulon n=1 Tax=Enterobacillus tribolii TaxID=1487935 RepID=A0A370QPU8_9GAMM|nr:helix-turn-helix domain-containing protein [Enterobacillus tribolii]MBW7981413.1 helix-turn-helix domain-containing protein [Enterobacillus tribolii]RDK90789.1 AraC family transcriptional activator of mar-sox-rob regulon [Enterobacillus tribolii]
MDKTKIINELIVWIEKNLDKPMTVDSVAAKAGYSKWHLQRMFKEITGQNIISYIRARKLNECALTLRLTKMPIIEVATLYHFDSQQAFNRAFKKQFHQAPAAYRMNQKWDMNGLFASMDYDVASLPEAHFVTMPEMKLVGFTSNYVCTYEEMAEAHARNKARIWGKMFNTFRPDKLYCLTIASDIFFYSMGIYYAAAFDSKFLKRSAIKTTEMSIPAGDYVKFLYEGPASGYQRFYQNIYHRCLPMLKASRPATATSYDVECLSRPDGAEIDLIKNPDTPIYCECFIPIIHNP